MDYEATYEYCAALQAKAVNDAYVYFDAGDLETFKKFIGLAREAVAMIKCCLLATDGELAN